jgi:ribosome-associated protein
MLPLAINDAVTLPARALTWSAARSSGPGGQNVNKVASKVDLRLDVDLCYSLEATTMARLRTLASQRLDAEGRIIVTSETTRDQRRNLDDAREKLRALVLRALERVKPRRATKPSRGAVARRLDGKRRVADKKRGRRDSPE